MISCSSFPNNPASPAWGLSAKTAIRGLSMPKSRLRALLSNVILVRIRSSVICAGISAKGTWLQTSATRRFPLQSIINEPLVASLGSMGSNRDSRYSVCPPLSASLLMGAVTIACTLPALRSAQARSSEAFAALLESGVFFPNSTGKLSV